MHGRTAAGGGRRREHGERAVPGGEAHTPACLLRPGEAGAPGTRGFEESIGGARFARLRERERKKIPRTPGKVLQIFEECSRGRNSFLMAACPPGADLKSMSIRERQKDYSS